MNTMRLLIATPLYPPDPGGPATYARLLETQLPGEGISVSLAKFGTVRAWPRGIRHLLYFLLVLFKGLGADTLLALDPVSTGYPTMLAARLLRKRFVVKIVGDYAWEQGQQRFGIHETLDAFVKRTDAPLPVLRLRRLQTKVALAATKIIVPSEYLKGIVASWGVPHEKITVIYNAVELSRIAAASSEVETLGHPRLIWGSGRMVPWKGVEAIIDTAATLKEHAPSLSLILIGNGPDKQVLTERAQTKLGASAHFTGPLPHGEALGTLEAADLYILNSTYEGLSHSLIEAMLLGKPIVATNVGGNPELITDGENGLLVEAGDTRALIKAAKRLLDDPELATRLGDAARRSAERFSVAILTRSTAVFFKSL